MDLQKAYDCVNWDLLRILLLQIGLDVKMTNWIMSCVVSSSYSVLINGEATELLQKFSGPEARMSPFAALVYPGDGKSEFITQR
jgi:hypothetical protein